MSDRIVRVLALPSNFKPDTKDAEGRTFGEDWQLADFGVAPDGKHYWLTTDHCHGTDVPEVLDDPAKCAAYVARVANRDYARYMRAWRKRLGLKEPRP